MVIWQDVYIFRELEKKTKQVSEVVEEQPKNSSNIKRKCTIFYYIK